MKGKKDLAIDTGGSLAGTGTGLVIGAAVGGPIGATFGAIVGAVLTPAVTDISKQLLSPKEVNRVEYIKNEAKKLIQVKLKQGAKPRTDIDLKKLGEVTEGILLSARKTYEEKKLHYIANLIAVAPFTNTPLENLNQTLMTAEQLSYRQFCILSVISKNQWEGELKLSKNPLSKEREKYLDEKVMGIYQDINYLIVLGIVGQVYSGEAGPAIASGTQFINPANLKILYPGTLLVNGLMLETIPNEDLQFIISTLQ